MKKDQVLDFMGSLEREDESFLQATAEDGGSCRRRFQESIERAKIACEANGLIVGDHFADVGKMINLAKGARREVADMKLSRYSLMHLTGTYSPFSRGSTFS